MQISVSYCLITHCRCLRLHTLSLEYEQALVPWRRKEQRYTADPCEKAVESSELSTASKHIAILVVC